MFGCVDAITLVINMLQLESLNQLTSHGSAAQQVDE